MSGAEIVTWVALGAAWFAIGLQAYGRRWIRAAAYYKGRLDAGRAIDIATDGPDFLLITRDQIALYLGEKEARKWDEEYARH